MSYRDALIDIISMAQQARPKVTGQIDPCRAQFTIFSTVVVRTGISTSKAMRGRLVRSDPTRPAVPGARGYGLSHVRAPFFQT
jgi:hypothetical protein